jgi:hypothetical protein
MMFRYYKERTVFTMKLRKIITMGLATVMAVSAMSISAFAANVTSWDEQIPTLSEVDTSLASRENPVKYIDEKTGTIVTIYDPDISVEFPEIMPYSTNSVVVDGRIYVKKGSTTSVGGATDSFEAPKTGTVYFTLSDFQYDEYNVSLNKEGVTDSPLVVLENKATDVPVALKGAKSGVRYEFRVSSWLGAGSATYEATM